VVVRELLAQYTKQYQERPLFSLLWNWAESGGDKLRTSFLALNVNTVGNLAFLLKAVKFRERVLQRALVARIYYKIIRFISLLKPRRSERMPWFVDPQLCAFTQE
ncbi:Acyl-coenzyme A oxidase-like protein, partial [Galemys pyrenaicus]